MITVKFRIGGQTFYGVLADMDARTRVCTVQYCNQNGVQSTALLPASVRVRFVNAVVGKPACRMRGAA